MTLSECLVCGTKTGEPFFAVDSAPALCHRLCRTEAQALEQPKGPIQLVLCPSCGLIFNRAFDAGLLRYDGRYENALHFSAVFREYEEDLAKELAERHTIRDSTVVEIGCGDGHFLSALCRSGAKQGLGFDPAYDAARASVDENVQITPGHFDAESIKDRKVALVCCRHVLEHIERPALFLRELRSAFGTRPVPVFFEVPSAMHTLEGDGFWDVIFEHVTYFTPVAIRRLFEECGFQVSRIDHRYSGQFLTIEAIPDPAPSSATSEGEDIRSLTDLARKFEKQFDAHRAEWTEKITGFSRTARRAVIWGAGSKTVSFLNCLAIGPDVIGHVVDVNPRKHGCYIVGAGQRIIAPNELIPLEADVVILLNPAYTNEVRSTLNDLGCRASLDVVAEHR